MRQPLVLSIVQLQAVLAGHSTRIVADGAVERYLTVGIRQIMSILNT
jgi:hypothetical protein